MGLSVRRPAGQVDTWEPIPGETRWVDYAHQRDGDDLVVFLHAFRRVRERLDGAHDRLLWKPSTTRLARRYAAGEWADVGDVRRHWPPVEVQVVARRGR